MASILGRLATGVQNMLGRGSKQSSSPDEPRFAEDYVAFVNKEFERVKKERIPYELQARLNIAFVSGNQYVQMNVERQSLEDVPLMYEWEERKQYDQMSPILEVRVARLTRAWPKRKVRPASGEARDIGAAEVSAKILEAAEQETGAREQLSELVPWMELCGVAWKKQVWNPDKGRVVGMMQATDELGNPTGEPDEVYEGDIDPTVVPFFEGYLDNAHASWRAQRFFIHAKAYHIDEIRDRWGVEVQPEPCDAFTLQANSGTSGVKPGYRLVTTRLEKHAIVKEYYERPTRKHKRGRFIVVAGQTLLHVGDLPFNVGKDGRPDIPFVPFYSLQKPGKGYGDTVYARLIPIQQQYNALRNRKNEALKREAIGQLVVEEGALVNQDEIYESGTSPGQVFIVNPQRQGPEYIKTPPLSKDFDTEEQTLLGEFRALSGVSDLAKVSQAPSGVNSGIAMSIALEQDETRISTTAHNIEEGIIEEGKMWLRLYKQFAQGPRVARVASTSEVELVDWDASFIRSDDVILEAMSGLGESPAQRRQFVLELLNTPLLMDPETGQLSREGRSKLLQMLEFGNWESAADTDYDLQVSKARRQVKAVKQGLIPVVSPIDDPDVHLKELTRWMLSSEFDELSQMNPNVAAAAYQFQAELTALLQQQLLMQLQAQGAVMPTPAGGGAPAPKGGGVPQMAAPPVESPEVANAMSKRNALMRQSGAV